MNTRLLTAAALSAVSLAALAGFTSARAESRPAVLETRAAQRLYEVDNVHTSVVFKIRHAGVSNFYGRFNGFTGEVHFDQADPAAARIAFTVQTDSVDTGNDSRDAHLKNADFFNSRQFPEITFTSTGLKKSGDAYELTGDLTLQGVTRPVTAILTPFSTGQFMDTDRLGFEARFSIKRSDFGMTKYLATDGGEGGALGNTVDLIVAVEAVGK